MQTKRIATNGVEISYLEAGDPSHPLALCLHGFPDHAPTFEPLLNDLAEAGFQAVAPWLRGYPPSGFPEDGDYRTTAVAQDALALADALAPSKDAVIIGHDWGAGAAYSATASRPERFSRLVTLAVPYGLGAGLLFNFAQMKRSWYIFFFQMPAIPEMAVRANDFAFIDNLWNNWSPGYTPQPEFMKRLKETLGAEGALEAALGYYRAIFRPGGLSNAPGRGTQTIAVPTLYLHGEDDGCVGAEMVHRESIEPNFSAGIEVDIIPGCGHFLHLEKPEVVNNKIIDFLTRR